MQLFLAGVAVACRKRKCADTTAQCRFPELAMPNVKMVIYLSNKMYGSNVIKQHSETVIVWNYQNDDCSLIKIIVSFVIIFGTLSFPMGTWAHNVLFCSVAILDPSLGHTMHVLSPFIPVFCHSDWLFHGESCPHLDVVHPGRVWPSSPACTWHCSLHYLILQATPLFPHGVTVVC